MSQGLCKVSHPSEPLLRIFGECCEENIFDLGRKVRTDVSERGRRTETVLIKDLRKRSPEGSDATEPFVYYDAQSILIAGRMRPPLDLFWRHIWDGATEILGAEGVGNRCCQSDPKVTEQQRALWADEHVFWFDIPVDDTPVMRVL